MAPHLVVIARCENAHVCVCVSMYMHDIDVIPSACVLYMCMMVQLHVVMIVQLVEVVDAPAGHVVEGMREPRLALVQGKEGDTLLCLEVSPEACESTPVEH